MPVRSRRAPVLPRGHVTRLRVATRRSRLAIAQTGQVIDSLRAEHPDLDIETVTISSFGDLDRESPLTALPETGAFTKALQDALLCGDADLAVHSLKDLPTQEPAGLHVAGVPRRADPEDVLVSRSRGGLGDLDPAAVVGTGSPRRRLQLLERRPDLSVVELRGNVDTRVRKVEVGDVDAAVLARAGLERLGLGHAVAEVLDFVPAPGQGALALECRVDDDVTTRIAAAVSDADTWLAVDAERAWLAATGAGCRTSAGALAAVEGDSLRLDWYYEGRSGSGRAGRSDAAALGERLAAEALA